MNADFEYELTPDQWEALKAIRTPTTERGMWNRFVITKLTALGLAEMVDDRPVITPKGRSVLLRGSPRLWDVAA
jgi:ribosomal protein S19E (S16A)